MEHKKEHLIEAKLFFQVKEEIINFLSGYEFVVELDAKLYILDRKALRFLNDCNKRLLSEFTKENGLFDEFNLSKIIKIINEDKPANWFRTYCAYHWREINDKEKVLKGLSGELEKHFNKLSKNVKRQLKKKEISEDKFNEILASIKTDYEKAKAKVKFMKDNEEILEMKISAYARRKMYPRVDFKINKIRQTAVGLKSTSLNGIWFEELEDDLKANANNELIKFFKDAENPFGDVFFRYIDKVVENEK